MIELGKVLDIHRQCTDITAVIQHQVQKCLRTLQESFIVQKTGHAVRRNNGLGDLTAADKCVRTLETFDPPADTLEPGTIFMCDHFNFIAVTDRCISEDTVPIVKWQETVGRRFFPRLEKLREHLLFAEKSIRQYVVDLLSAVTAPDNMHELLLISGAGFSELRI